MMQKISKEDIELILIWREKPSYFIEKVFKLVPQPVKPQYEEAVANLLEKNWNAWEEAKPQFNAEMFEVFLPNKHITWQQWLVIMCVEKAIRGETSMRIAIKSGVGTGKSSILAILIIWFLFCYQNAQVPCTAPTSEQIHDILWKEIKLWLDRMPPYMAEKFDWTSGYLRIIESPETWFARARTGRKENPEALAGIHAKRVLLGVDEASGVPDEIFVKSEGVMSGEFVLVILISQCTRLTGYFYECFHKDKANWQCLSLDAEESPIVNYEFVTRILTKYGDDSDEYRVQVKGMEPKSEGVDDRGFVPLIKETDLKYCTNTPFIGRVKMGIDPSGGGSNESVWVIRDQFKARKIAKEKISTPKSGAMKTLTLMALYGIKATDIFIDNFGEGANWAQELALSGVRVNGVNTGDPPEDIERYLNRRAEISWRVKDWMRMGGELVNDPSWKECLNIKFRANLRNKITIMPKEMMRRLGIQSPDTWDALTLTFWEKDNFGGVIKTHDNSDKEIEIGDVL